jgi:hypothetical protein
LEKIDGFSKKNKGKEEGQKPKKKYKPLEYDDHIEIFLVDIQIQLYLRYTGNIIPIAKVSFPP